MTDNMKDNKEVLRTEEIRTDVLIIGGGTAGCCAAAWLGKHTSLRILIAEKANIQRSGCLAAGVNALNAYISEGHVPQDYVEYARRDAEGIVRNDLLITIAEQLNEAAEDLEHRGLVILKDESGKYKTRGWRNVKINGENIKPVLAKAAEESANVTVLNHVNITDLRTEDKKGHRRVTGAYGFSVKEPVFYDIRSSAVLIATGGAAGLYRPNNPGFSRHKMWYPPFNTGAGYAMGFLAGAEMTTFENRFIALRCKDTIAPTGTIAQGIHARQINAEGKEYESRYGITTPERIYGTVEEKRAGRGPCFLETEGISREAEEDLYRAYLNMAPSQTLRWLESGCGPSERNVEIDGTEPYIVGGHTASGFWVDTGRRTTLAGLYAAGDVAGGAPQKYVTGAVAEGKIAARSIASDLKKRTGEDNDETTEYSGQAEIIRGRLERHFSVKNTKFDCEMVEESMQKVMDEYAGGIRTDYRYNEAGLRIAKDGICELETIVPELSAENMFDLLHIQELRERLVVCRILIAHLEARKETRWHIFGENTDYPDQDPEWNCYVNSKLDKGSIRVIRRPLVAGREYQHPEEEVSS